MAALTGCASTYGVTDGRGHIAAIRDALIDRIGHEDRAHRRIARGQAFGDRHQVRLDAFAFAREERAGAAEAGDDFIGDEKNIELAAGFAHRFQPALGRHDHTARTLDRLAEKRGDVVRAEFRDLRFERLHRRRDERGVIGVIVAVRVRRRNVMLRRQRQIEVAMERGQRSEARADRRRAVIAALQRDEMLLRGAARRVVVVRDEAQRGIDGIRAAEREIHVLQRCGRELDELRGQLDRGL